MKRRTQWWCVIDVDREITRYFRWWVERRYGTILYKPSWDAHISVIRGEKPKPHLMHLWKKYNGQVVEFEYSNVVRQSSDTTGSNQTNSYWFIDIHCPKLTEIRKELEIPYNWKLHITIGRTW